MIYGELDEDERDEVLYLEKSEIDECEDAETLCRWYRNARDLADDVIAQLEANKISEARDEDWVRRASGTLIGLKKTQKAVERRARTLDVDIPRTPSAKDDKRIEDLRAKLLEARNYERGVIVEWLADRYGEDAGPVIEAINAREHYAHRHAKLDSAQAA